MIPSLGRLFFFELETDKAILDVPSPTEGVLLKILTPAGQVRVEEVVGWIGAAGEGIPAGTATVSHRPPKRLPAGASSTPAARRRARELGVDIASVRGSGPNGRITQEDVERAAASHTRTPKLPEQSRGELARSLFHAWQTVPHIHISRRLEADALAQASEEVHSRQVSVTDLLLFAVSRVLPDFPEITRIWEGERLEPATAIHLAFAVDSGKGVTAPVIQSADSLDLEQISAHRRELADAARLQRVKLADLNKGVFTLTNLGMEGADFFAPIINWPQTAILATGRMTREPVVRGDSIGVGWRMWANLALDHRAIDGAAGARFLAKLQDKLNQMAEEL